MSETAVITALVLAVLLGVGGAAFLVMRSPAFWGEVLKELVTKAWPLISAVITKPESDAVRQARQKCERSGGVWDHARKQCRNR